MRYNCPSCSRVFYLDAKTVSPCPACGTMLQMQGDDAGGGADNAAAPAPAPDENSWLDDSVAEEAVAPPAAPGASGGMPSAATWLSPGATPQQTPAAGDDSPLNTGLDLHEESVPLPPGQTAQMAGAGATAQMPGAGSSPAMATSSTMMAGQARPTMGMRVGSRGPSGTKIFFITAIAMIVAATIAIAIMMVVKPQFEEPDPTKLDPAAVVAGQQSETLRKQLNEKKDELVRLQLDAAKQRKDLEDKIAQMEADASKLRGGFTHVLDASALTLRANTLLERRADLTTALAVASAAIKKDAAFGPAHRVRGKVLAATGRAAEAVAAFEKADAVARQSGKPGDAQALVCAGETSLTSPNGRDKAIVLFNKAAALDPANPFSKYAAARVTFINGKWEEAAKAARDVQALAPTNPLAPLLIGEVAYEQAMLQNPAKRDAELKAASKVLANAVRLDPNSPRACLLYGRVLLEQAKLVSAGPGFGVMRLGRQSQAERMLSKAMDLSPTVPEVHLALAELRLNTGALRDPAIALSRAGEAVRLTDRRNAPSLAALAAAQAATGSPKKAVTTMREALQIDPKNNDYVAALRRYEADAKALRR